MSVKRQIEPILVVKFQDISFCGASCALEIVFVSNEEKLGPDSYVLFSVLSWPAHFNILTHIFESFVDKHFSRRASCTGTFFPFGQLNFPKMNWKRQRFAILFKEKKFRNDFQILTQRCCCGTLE